jgi:hypothetical protein
MEPDRAAGSNAVWCLVAIQSPDWCVPGILNRLIQLIEQDVGKIVLNLRFVGRSINRGRNDTRHIFE